MHVCSLRIVLLEKFLFSVALAIKHVVNCCVVGAVVLLEDQTVNKDVHEGDHCPDHYAYSANYNPLHFSFLIG